MDEKNVMNGTPPIGSLVFWAGKGKPDSTDWLLCDGQSVSKEHYSELYKMLKTSGWIKDEREDTFKLPKTDCLYSSARILGAILLIRAR